MIYPRFSVSIFILDISVLFCAKFYIFFEMIIPMIDNSCRSQFVLLEDFTIK